MKKSLLLLYVRETEDGTVHVRFRSSFDLYDHVITISEVIEQLAEKFEVSTGEVLYLVKRDLDGESPRP